MFVIWLCVFLYSIGFGEGVANNSRIYIKQWNRCSDEYPFLILRNIAIEKCVSECNIRTACLAVNYWTRRLTCDMLFNDTGYPLQQGNDTHPCVFVKKTDFGPGNELPSNCSECDNKTACISGECVIKECRQLEVQNATIKGNMLSVGSKIRIYCNSLFSQHPPETLSICQANGTWSNEPTCRYLFACPEPPSIANATVDTGTQAVGDVRYYNCSAGCTAIGTGALNMSIQCQENDTWTAADFQCVADCGDPVDVALATVSVGSTLEGTNRTYTCDDGYVGNSSVMTVTCQAYGDWSTVEFSCIPQVCEPGWHYIGDSCYLPQSGKVLLDDAKAFCSDRGSHVVAFETESEHTTVVAYLAALHGQKWWIDLSDEQQEGEWRWMTTGERANYSKWDTSKSEPNAAIGHDYVILEMSTGLWQAVDSYTTQHVICEK